MTQGYSRPTSPIVMTQPLAQRSTGVAGGPAAIHTGGRRRPNLFESTNPPPPPPGNCPPGLEILEKMDQISVMQQVELCEAICRCESQNRYDITDCNGTDIFKAKEDTNWWTRHCCGGPLRPFDLEVRDNSDREVIHVVRPRRCVSCWTPCCLQELSVYAPPGVLIGSIHQEWSFCTPQFFILDGSRKHVLRIEGPCYTASCCCNDVVFKVLSADGGSEVGQIRKKWSGFVKEAFTDADNFGMSFPVDLDVRKKATLLGALFLIDYMYFELM